MCAVRQNMQPMWRKVWIRYRDRTIFSAEVEYTSYGYLDGFVRGAKTGIVSRLEGIIDFSDLNEVFGLEHYIE